MKLLNLPDENIIHILSYVLFIKSPNKRIWNLHKSKYLNDNRIRDLQKKYRSIKDACKNNDPQSALYIVYNIDNFIWLPRELLSKYAARYGYKKLLRYSIYMNATNWKQIAIAAAKLGDEDTIEYACERIKLNKPYGIIAQKAAQYGHRELLYQMINKNGVNGYDFLLINAMKGNNLDIVKEIIKLGGQFIFGKVIYPTNRDIIIYLYENNLISIELLILGAAIGGHNDLVEKFEILHKTEWYKYGIRDIVKKNNINVLNMVIQRGYNDWNSIAIYAAKYGNINLLKEMINHGVNDWYNIGIAAINGNQFDIFKYCVDNGFSDFELSYSISFKIQSREILRYLVDIKYISAKILASKLKYNNNYELSLYFKKYKKYNN